MTVDQLISNNLWLKGPTWLSHPSMSLCPGINDEHETNDVGFPSEEFKEGMAMNVIEQATPAFDFNKWRDFAKMMNITAWVLRFINNSKPNSTKF